MFFNAYHRMKYFKLIIEDHIFNNDSWDYDYSAYNIFKLEMLMLELSMDNCSCKNRANK